MIPPIDFPQVRQQFQLSEVENETIRRINRASKFLWPLIAIGAGFTVVCGKAYVSCLNKNEFTANQKLDCDTSLAEAIVSCGLTAILGFCEWVDHKIKQRIINRRLNEMNSL